MSANDKLTPGMVLGRYELLLPVAQGGMATVWAARQKGSRGFQKTVAIKTMLPALSDDPQFEQMFLDEAALAARIHHPNVAEILDLGEQEEILYLVMEWIDGEALSVISKAARKADVQLPMRVGLRILAQACAGLQAAHELRDDGEEPLQLVHRDVSPQNILVTYDGVVKLVDFGVAKAVGRAGGETTAGQLKGKVPYMSPEQARGGHVDRRTDIFAMGIVLYRLTTGLHPFMGENDLVTMRNIITRPVLPPRVKNPQYSAELEHIVLKCLQKEPDRRYASMLELQTAIERALMSMGAPSSVPPPPSSSAPPPSGTSVEDDVGGFVRGLMGERGAKRRAAIRDAIRAADERSGGSRPSMPVVHENVSEIVLTQMTSGIKDEALAERVSIVSGAPTSLVHTAPASGVPSERGLQTRPPLSKRKRLPLLAWLAMGAVAGVVVLMMVGGGRKKELVTPAATAAPAAPAAFAPAHAASSAQVAAAAPATSGSAAPTSSAMKVDDLPNVAQRPAPPVRRWGGPVRTGPAAPAPVAKPAPSAPSAAEPPKQPKPASTHYVPAVQNPGF
jgi:eukaryotic-like serine/threonine-protein kinase